MATRLPKTLDGEIEVPCWLQRQVDVWMNIPCVEAVVLFGSQAMSRAHAGSDWDVAVLHKGQCIEDFPISSDVEEHCVDVPLISLGEFRDSAHRVGSLAHELAANGMVLAGSVPELEKKGHVVSEGDLALHLEYAFRDLALSIADLPVDLRRAGDETPIARARAHVSSKHSADGAERVAKALCVHLGVTYDHTHDVERLSRLVSREWRNKVLAMDGCTRRARLSEKEESYEVVREVIRRISASLDLLGEIIVPCCTQLQLSSVRELEEQVSLSTAMQRVLTYTESESIHPEIKDLSKQMESVIQVLRLHLKNREIDQ